MIYLRLRPAEIRAITYYTGLITSLLGVLMIVPLLTSVVLAEWKVAVDFVISISITMSVSAVLMLLGMGGSKDLTWTQGMTAAAISYLIGMILAAIPYAVSHHWLSFLDASFDVMSGFTTTGLTLVQDLDHLPAGLNMWRHIISWFSGQGIIVLALTFFIRSMPGAFKLYVGEAKDERVRPNVVHTAQTIWYISLGYLGVGAVVLWIIGMCEGLPAGRGFLHALWVQMAAWSTGGFAPQYQNINYYHSFAFEIGAMVFFLLGSINFSLHWAVWTGSRRELLRNFETRTFFVTMTSLGLLAMWDLAHSGAYSGPISLFRRGFFALLSAHTGTGFTNLYSRQYVLEWDSLALLAILAAMLFGGSASSTAGGFKAVRIGVLAKAVVDDIRRLLLPDKAVIVNKFHMGRDVSLDDRMVRAALTIILLYIAVWGGATAVSAVAGYDLISSMYESASAVGNVGLSCGVATPAMPAYLKITYILAMWLGRLEFMAVLVLFGSIFAQIKGR